MLHSNLSSMVWWSWVIESSVTFFGHPERLSSASFIFYWAIFEGVKLWYGVLVAKSSLIFVDV